MTGKFTKHVHNLGYITGKSLHSLLLHARDIATSSSSLSSLSNSTSWLLSPIHEALKETSSSSTCNAAISSTASTCTTHEQPPQLSFTNTAHVLYQLLKFLIQLPNRYRIWWWNLLLNDPVHVLVETFLIVMCIALVVWQRRADWRLSQKRKKEGELSESEVEELLAEWKESGRKPLGGGSSNSSGNAGEGASTPMIGSGIIIDKIEGCHLYLHPDSTPYPSIRTTSSPTSTTLPPHVLNFATLDYLSSTTSPLLNQTALASLSHYGVGSCGPRGFYGTIDAHLELEQIASQFLKTESAILYSDGASAATSTIAAFAKRGDLLIVDEGVNEALLVGVALSRANVRYFRHNDVKDLRRVLEKVRANDVALRRKATDQRRFLVVEGLYRNWGTIAPLEDIVKLKEEFHYRLILDDSHGIGTLGEGGRGTLEHFGLKPMVHCEILTFSLENALGSVGGMTVGSEEVVDHQRLSGAGYCFSASAPPFLSKVCVASIRKIQGRLDELPVESEDGKLAETRENEQDGQAKMQELSGKPLLQKLSQNISNLYTTLTNSSHPHSQKLRSRLVLTSNPLSPLLYLRLSDEEASHRTRSEQTSVLDRIAHHCLMEGKVALVSTGGHVKKYLHLVPEPCLRVVANVSQGGEEVEKLVEALGNAVEAILGERVLFA